MKKRILALLLSLSLLAGAAPALAAPGKAPTWSVEAYDHLDGLGFVTNTADPSRDTYRSFLIQMLVRAVELALPQQVRDDLPQVPEDYFADRNDTLTRSAAAYGITEGKLTEGGRLFDAGGSLTRQEAAKMVCSVLDLLAEHGYAFPTDGESAAYADQAVIAPWAAPFTGRVASYGLMVGDQNGNFLPEAHLSNASAVVLVSRLVDLVSASAQTALPAQPVSSAMDWSMADRFGYGDYAVAKPKTGYAQGHFTAVDANGVFTGVVVGEDVISVERYDAAGGVTFSKSVPMELPIFGAFLAGEDGYYVAFGRENHEKDDRAETFRVVKYDKDWNRVTSVSAYGGETYTAIPFRSAIARMALREDGKTLALYAARQRYDGHQSNITFLMDADTLRMTELMGEEFPSNHVSHSFGQFVRFDGSEMVTVDHGDAYPRSFVLQAGGKAIDLLKIYGPTGENETNAIGSGLEVSDSGYLFLGCSDPQDGSGAPWNLFLAYVDKAGVSDAPTSMRFGGVTVSTKPAQYGWTITMNGNTYYVTGTPSDVDRETVYQYVYDFIDATTPEPSFTWLTNNETTINCARLVKVDRNTFAALWDDGGELYLQLLDGKGGKMGDEQVYENIPMPPTEPVVYDGHICYLQVGASELLDGAPLLYRIPVGG